MASVTVQLLAIVGTAFASAWVGIMMAMLIAYSLTGQPLQPWLAPGIAGGCALAAGARMRWKMSNAVGAALFGLLAGVGYLAGGWLSTHV